MGTNHVIMRFLPSCSDAIMIAGIPGLNSVLVPLLVRMTENCLVVIDAGANCTSISQNIQMYCSEV